MVEGKPTNFLLVTGCNTNVKEANVQSADALKPAMEFIRPGTQTTNETSVPVQQEAGLGTRTTIEMGVPVYQAIGSSSSGLGTRTTTELSVSVCQVRGCLSTVKGEAGLSSYKRQDQKLC